MVQRVAAYQPQPTPRKRCKFEQIRQSLRKNASLEEIRDAAARICRDYLTGRWKIIAPEDLIVKRISGGLSNFLYYVSLPTTTTSTNNATTTTTAATATTTTTPTMPIAIAPKNVSSDVIAVGQTMAAAVAIYDKNSNAQNATKRQQQILRGEQVGSPPSPSSSLPSSLSAAVGAAIADDDVFANTSALFARMQDKSLKRQRTNSEESSDSSASKRTQLLQEPQEILLRIYGQTHGEDALETLITESVVFALLSERNFGPKLHGIFPGGRIEQYIPASSLNTTQMSDHRISMKVAEKMGEIHSLNIPMSKEPDWIWNCMKRWLKTMGSVVQTAVDNKTIPATALDLQSNCIDFREEMRWLKSIIEQGNYPVVFCHNDLQQGNILLRHPTETAAASPRVSIGSLRDAFDETLGDSLDGNSNSNGEYYQNNDVDNEPRRTIRFQSTLPTSIDTADDSALDASFTVGPEPDLIIIDFEYCAYNYRGFDLANHFVEWTFDYSNPSYPFYYHNNAKYPTAAERRDFITIYLRRYHNDDDYEPSELEVCAVDAEIRLFRMFSHLFWSLWAVVNVTSTIEFAYWDYALERIGCYKKLKAAYIAASIENP